jgi:hypothetical protein
VNPTAVLAYCVADLQGKPGELPRTGVQAGTIRAFEVDGLRCLFGEVKAPQPDERALEDVRAFSRVLQVMFAQFAIIPFRFPTVLASEAELQNFVRSHSIEYREALDRLRDKVQMDLRVTLDPGVETETQSISGKSYLEHRHAQYRQLESAIQNLQKASGPFAQGWVQRESSSGIRAFVLIDRALLDRFVQSVSKVQTPAGILVRVTGPWPPSEFVEDGNE